jgi:hypothetical protein
MFGLGSAILLAMAPVLATVEAPVDILVVFGNVRFRSRFFAPVSFGTGIALMSQTAVAASSCQ